MRDLGQRKVFCFKVCLRAFGMKKFVSSLSEGSDPIESLVRASRKDFQGGETSHVGGSVELVLTDYLKVLDGLMTVVTPAWSEK